MNKLATLRALGICIGTLAGVTISGCSAGKEDARETGAPDAPRPSSGTVSLSAEQQRRAAIGTIVVRPREFAQEVPAFGRVLDPTSILDALGETRAAETAQDATTRDYERLRQLRANDLNASARDLEAAAAARDRDIAQYGAARNKLRSLGGEVLLRQQDSEKIVSALESGRAALIRVDVPSGDPLVSQPIGARIPATDHAPETSLRLLGGAPSDPQVSSRGYLLLSMPDSLDLRPSTSVMAAIRIGSGKARGWLVPRASLVRTEGRAWVYVRRDATTFVRTAVEVVSIRDEGVFISAPSDLTGPLVSSGAQTLLSEEQKSNLRVED